MPVIFPVVPAVEADVPTRIRRKYGLYVKEYEKYLAGRVDAASIRGDRYEILCAIDLWRRGKIATGNQIGYKSPVPGMATSQQIRVGFNTEYDLALPNLATFPALMALGNPAGGILIEAKSYSAGIGPYMKRAVGFILNDPTIGGVFFVTPMPPIQCWSMLVSRTYEILADRAQVPGGAGGDQWLGRAGLPGKPSGAAIRTHFSAYNTPALIAARSVQPVPVIHQELSLHAGFMIGVWQVPAQMQNTPQASHDIIRNAVASM